MNLKDNKFRLITIFILIFQSIIISLFIPIYEFPDAWHHLSNIKNIELSNNIYYKIQNLFLFQEFELKKQLINLNFKFGSNTARYIYTNYVLDNFFLGQLLNLFFIILFVSIFMKILDRDQKLSIVTKKRVEKITLLFFLWPQIIYYNTNLSSDFFIILYQPLFLYLILKRKYLFNLITILFLIKFVDNNALTNLIFLLVYTSLEFIYKKRKKLGLNKKKILLLVGVTLIVVYFIITKSFILKLYFPNVYKHMIYNYSVGSQSFLRRIIAIFLSSLYLSGSMSFRFNIFIYLLYGILIFQMVWKVMKKRDVLSDRIYLNLLSSFSTIIITLIIIPALGQLKYYTFLILFLLELLYVYLFSTGNSSEKKLNLIILFIFYLNIFITLFVSYKIYL